MVLEYHTMVWYQRYVRLYFQTVHVYRVPFGTRVLHYQWYHSGMVVRIQVVFEIMFIFVTCTEFLMSFLSACIFQVVFEIMLYFVHVYIPYYGTKWYHATDRCGTSAYIIITRHVFQKVWRTFHMAILPYCHTRVLYLVASY